MNRSAREGKSVKRFERSDGLDTALYKNYLYVYIGFLILNRSQLLISQTVRIDWHPFLSRVRISVWPSVYFVIGENPKKISAKFKSSTFYIPGRAKTKKTRSKTQKKLAQKLSRSTSVQLIASDNCCQSGDKR